MESRKSLDNYVNQIVNSIGVGKISEWTKKQLEASFGVRNDIVKEIKDTFVRKDVFDDAKINERFLDFCNAIRVLLIVYNYGDMDISKFEGEEIEKIKGADVGTEEEDKKIILTGITKILDYVERNGFSIAPYMGPEEINNIFAVSDADDKSEWPIMPITISATTVLITLIYFRRAIKRKNLFSEEDLFIGGKNYHVLMVETVTKILRKIYDFANAEVPYRTGRFMGWGFTLDSAFSQSVTLSDTYAVVDAINRFAEAFDSDDQEKRDDQFLKEINDCNNRIYGSDDGDESEFFVKKCISSIYKTALNVYRRTQKVYGAGVFFEDATKVDGKIQYNYYLTSYNQIASSIRSSALFNPLYVALITLYGYNDKEIVIGRFMDDPALVKSYYYDKNDGNIKEDLVAFAKELSGFDRDDFINRVEKLIKCAPSSAKYGSAVGWTELHATARVFQKYLEKMCPEDLMKITEYQDYLNATKDAIDQVQVMYRNFYNGQRYGVVDTDYSTFSDLDIKTNDALNISRLNKASMGINSLRPILLSAKILIVNALVKYPNADVSDMYQAIIESRYRPGEKRTSKKSQGQEQKWLWNEDVVDMNSTCRHCEVIMYDYFDYYDKYELGLKTLNLLKSKRVSGEDRAVNGEKEEVFVIEQDGSLVKTLQAEAFENLILELSKRNVDIAKEIYNKRLKGLELQHQKEKEVLAKDIEELKKTIQEKDEKIDSLLKEKSNAVTELKESSSYQMGETMKNWMRSELETSLVEMMSMLILMHINYGTGEFNTSHISDYNMYDANQPEVKNYLHKIDKEYEEDKDKAADKYNAYAKKVDSYSKLIDMAMDGIFQRSLFEGLRMGGDKDKQNEDFVYERNNSIQNLRNLVKEALDTNTDELIKNVNLMSGYKEDENKDSD